VLTSGPVTAAQLSAELGITPAAVRRHLDALVADGLVRQAPLAAGSRGPGRPARGWVATEAAHAAEPGAYDDLATAALAALERELGRGALERFAQARADELEARHREQVEAAGTAPAARAGALAQGLTGDGYAARAAVVGARHTHQPGVQLCQGHCPVQSVAARYPELCEAETAAFSRLLGVPVRRLATLAAGHHACTTHVTTARPDEQTSTQTSQQSSTTHQTTRTAPTTQGRSA
jgi:predicted ArsR family transcriptional regulator